jgi:hypothetical protein
VGVSTTRQKKQTTKSAAEFYLRFKIAFHENIKNNFLEIKKYFKRTVINV